MKDFLHTKTLWIISLLIATILAVSAAPLLAEEGTPTGDVSVAVLSKYIWRGQELSRDSIVIQPSATIGYNGFSANVWGNLDTSPYYSGIDPDKSYSTNWTETDLTLSYSKTLGMFNLTGGYIYYGLNAANADSADLLDSQEIFVSVGLDILFSPALTVYKDIDHYHQWYFLLGVSHAFELNEVISLELAATASYLMSDDESTYPEYDDDATTDYSDKFRGFHDGTLTVSLPIQATSYITLTPTISYVFPLSDDAENEMKGRGMSGAPVTDHDSSFLYGGLIAGFAF